MYINLDEVAYDKYGYIVDTDGPLDRTIEYEGVKYTKIFYIVREMNQCIISFSFILGRDVVLIRDTQRKVIGFSTAPINGSVYHMRIEYDHQTCRYNYSTTKVEESTSSAVTEYQPSFFDTFDRVKEWIGDVSPYVNRDVYADITFSFE